MNTTRTEAVALATAVVETVAAQPMSGLQTLLFPPFVWLCDVLQTAVNSGIRVGAQNCHHETHGAFTGEISAAMVRDTGASHVLIGHSERRLHFGETDALLLQKTRQALANGLVPVFCIGETLPERESGAHFATVRRQLTDGLLPLGADALRDVVIAYEPVWAIGTGVTASAEQAQEMHAFIRTLLRDAAGDAVAEAVPLLYGGSCNPANAASLFACADVDGGLIGGAALKAVDFLAIRTAMHNQLS